MSWLWSSPPPSDEPPTPIPEIITEDPYARSPTSDFGTAFDDDLPYPSPHPSTDSFEFYSPQSDTFSSSFPTSFDTSTSPSSSQSPSLDFRTMRQIDPALISPGSSIRSRSAAPAVDYVFTDDYKSFRKKSGTEQLTYLAGSAYLTGALVGGSRGCYQGLAASIGKPPKLRLNAVLNATGRQGALLANAFGILALAFSLSESAVYNYSSDETMGNYALAGAAAGALYKSTRGGRVAAVWSAGGAVLALGTVYASRRGYYGQGLQGIL